MRILTMYLITNFRYFSFYIGPQKATVACDWKDQSEFF